MLKFLSDEDLDRTILRALIRRYPEIDVLRVQDVGLRTASDDAILSWSAENDRLVLSHDVSTMTRSAYQRVIHGDGMPGLIIVSREAAIKDIIHAIALLAFASVNGEWEGQVLYVR